MIEGEMVTGSVSYWTITYNEYLIQDIDYVISIFTNIII
jgi:hypothetical protein